MTLAKPEIAAYPFTTLMPNLGCLEGDPLKSDGGFSTGPTMADLPGLIKDAHLGKVSHRPYSIFEVSFKKCLLTFLVLFVQQDQAALIY